MTKRKKDIIYDFSVKDGSYFDNDVPLLYQGKPVCDVSIFCTWSKITNYAIAKAIKYSLEIKGLPDINLDYIYKVIREREVV